MAVATKPTCTHPSLHPVAVGTLVDTGRRPHYQMGGSERDLYELVARHLGVYIKAPAIKDVSTLRPRPVFSLARSRQ